MSRKRRCRQALPTAVAQVRPIWPLSAVAPHDHRLVGTVPVGAHIVAYTCAAPGAELISGLTIRREVFGWFRVFLTALGAPLDDRFHHATSSPTACAAATPVHRPARLLTAPSGPVLACWPQRMQRT